MAIGDGYLSRKYRGYLGIYNRWGWSGITVVPGP
jgi:hypothetical protein